MKFRTRPFLGVQRMNGAAPTPGPNMHWTVSTGDRVTLHPDQDDFGDELQVEVIAANGEHLRVRALHDLYFGATQRMVRLGEEFQVTRAHVFTVRALAGLSWMSMWCHHLRA